MQAQILVGQASCLPGNGGQDARPTRRSALSDIISGNHYTYGFYTRVGRRTRKLGQRALCRM